MQTPFAAEISGETHRLVEPLLPEDNVYRLVGSEIEKMIDDKDFIDMYPLSQENLLTLPNSYGIMVALQWSK
jgi:hypothetical protein